MILVRLTKTEADKHSGFNWKTLSALLNCESSLTPEMAIRIGKATKTTPESWLFMQAKYDLWNTEQNAMDIEKVVELAVA